MNDIGFVKVSGSGNDFIIIDNRNNQLQASGLKLQAFVREVCQRKTSVGADGVLLLESSATCNVKMRVFNPDGSEVQMCGNGARCVALWAKSKIQNQSFDKLRIDPERSRMGPKSKIKIETEAGELEAEVVSEDRVKLKMSDPKGLRLDFGLKVDEKELKVNYINTGVPHVVWFVDDLEGLDVRKLGSLIRYHQEFQPGGTNANFVKVIDEGTIKVRTYERGVEDETLSCGTGAVASAIISAQTRSVKPPVSVRTHGGSTFKVYFDGNLAKNVYLEGEAKIVYEGKIKTGY